MSMADGPSSGGWRSRKALVLTAALLGFGGLGYFALGLGNPSGRPPSKATGSRTADDELASARDLLAKDVNVAACEAAIRQINSHLTQHADQRPPAVAGADLDKLRDQYGLDAGEMAEVENASYTTLDAQHLAACLLFRDAAKTIAVEETGSDGKPLRPTGLERATAAFAWVMRQVRPLESSAEPAPPVFALRRGRGSSLERALVFLALLEQMPGPEKLMGCLITLPGKAAEPARLWGCGVAIGAGRDLYVFDPRLGLPLPGPGGRGVATLTAVRSDPAVLAQLDGGKEKYDVDAEQAKTADLWVPVTLSMLAPRLRHLQETLLPRSLAARLAADPADGERLQAAATAAGAGAVKPWTPGVGLLRRFLPKEEGGSAENDPAARRLSPKSLFELSLVPLDALPRLFRDERKFPVTVGLGQRVLAYFSNLFIRPVSDPQGARDLLLRGRYRKAIESLVQEDQSLREAQAARAKVADLDKQVDAWVALAIPAYADQQRARGNAQALADANGRIEKLWSEANAVGLLLTAAAAGPRDADVTYQIGLCMHEQAEQLQARLDLLVRSGAKPEAANLEKARQAWIDAKGSWERFVDDFARDAAAPTARVQLGRTKARLGDWQGAAAVWENVDGPMTAPEKVAAQYRARMCRQEHEAKK